jgi:glutaminyl-peptide cyclotransferase
VSVLTNLTLLTALTLLTSGCNSKPTAELQPGQFDSARAFEHVRQLVSFGPRPSGSAALERTAAYIQAQLQGYGLAVEEQVFTAPTPDGPKQFRNLIGRSRVQTAGPDRVIILASHYDTKWMTNVTFVGANDGGSGTGALLEIARVAANQPDLWFVFFDGEEALVEYGSQDGLWGSKYLVDDLRRRNELKRIRALVLLDMIGDKNLNVTVYGTFAPQVFDAARAAGFRDFFSYGASAMLDDHVPFLQAGIPAVDLIDFEYGSAPGRNDYWHTANDTLDKISPRSLEIVGQTTLRLIELLRNQAPGH